MTSYAVTGATGHLGRLVIDDLLARGVPSAQIVAIARDPGKAADLAERGVVVREGDYSRPETLPAALEGVQTLLLISGSEVGHRVPQHAAVIDAARAAGVRRIVYTSLPKADTSTSPLAPEHKATEALLRDSGIPFTILRNNWYLENYTDRLGEYLGGEVVGLDGSARIAGATRADFAAAAAAALVGTGHENAIYELGGIPFTYPELADAISDVTGTAVRYRNATPDELRAGLTAAGADEGTAGFVVALEESIAQGALDGDDKALTALLGRPATTLVEALRTAHSGQTSS